MGEGKGNGVQGLDYGGVVCCGTSAESEDGGWGLKCEKRRERVRVKVGHGMGRLEGDMFGWIVWGIFMDVNEGVGFLEAFS